MNDNNDIPNTSPIPQTEAEVPKAEFPICNTCHKPVEQLRWLDYADTIRVVMHIGPDCVLGVIKI